MSARFVASVFTELQNNDSVIGPAEDGGYVLLGLRKPQPKIFANISWGSSKVFEETVARFKGDVKTVPMLWDVDHVNDLIRLRNSAHELQLGREFSDYLANLEW